MNKCITLESYLDNLCEEVRLSIKENDYDRCKDKVCEAMGLFPHSAIPHNLIGIILEYEGDHALAMNHFRAGWALDPLYLPSRFNLESFGTFISYGKCAYTIDDCNDKTDPKGFVKIQDNNGVYHYERRIK